MKRTTRERNLYRGGDGRGVHVDDRRVVTVTARNYLSVFVCKTARGRWGWRVVRGVW